ncbi:GDSL esterase/lipase At2g40250-like [Rosa rugosa]|uniref:GDSL esterase/lipase At2g40250-like n=1 Tax=Rosa rugosa TaxID=74645 RepID=UPI002B400E6B|nr:GDSL esterase/lipase At2g40250-like [Rosa rugosa]
MMLVWKCIQNPIAHTVMFTLLFSLATLIILPPSPISASSPSVSALFAFGDSTVDSGMNNDLLPFVRCDHPPYGRDLPDHVPTGRYSNGKIATDFMASNLGLKDLLPAYLDPKLTDYDLLTGVSFASGTCGLDDLTLELSHVYSMGDQLEYFDEAVVRMKISVGEKKGREIVENALFVVSVGTNDLMLNVYEFPLTERKTQFTSTDQYSDFLLQRLGSFIQALYSRGARRFMVAGLPPIGCLPLQQTLSGIINLRPQRLCVTQQNIDCQTYNSKLQALLSSLQTTLPLPSSRLVYFDIYNPIMDMYNNPDKYGFVHIHEGCCGTGMLELGPLCTELSRTCPDASKYLFWDAVHPTEAAFFVIADYAHKTVLQYLS